MQFNNVKTATSMCFSLYLQRVQTYENGLGQPTAGILNKASSSFHIRIKSWMVLT